MLRCVLIKWEKKYTDEPVPKPNRKILKSRVKFDNTNKQIYDEFLSWLCTSTAINREC